MTDHILPLDGVFKASVDTSVPDHDETRSLKSLLLLIHRMRLQQLKETTYKELQELKNRQRMTKELHDLLRSINTAADTKSAGAFDCSNNQELKDLLKKAKEHGIDLKEDKFKYTKEERDRLVENIRMACDDYGVESDMQIQAISKLSAERLETHQFIRHMLKVDHDDMIRKAREMSGRS